MASQTLPQPGTDTEHLFEAFENLMPFRVQDILLVSSLYDSFILREDGRLNELLVGESLELNLQRIPGITQVSTGAEALALAISVDGSGVQRHDPVRNGDVEVEICNPVFFDPEGARLHG